MRRGLVFGAVPVVVLLGLLYGPLFPWSPWKPGYEHLALRRADVYWPKGTVLPEAFRELDELIEQTEQFEQLAASKRITVVHCGTWVQFRRLMPHMSQRVVAAVTLATGAQIYFTPKVSERGLNYREFLLHELAHALINQHQTLWNAFRFSKVEWLSEGIAVANGRQQAYLTLGEVLSRARGVPLGPVLDPERREGTLDMRFAYPVWRYFNEYLMTRFGREAYQRFLLAVAADPAGWREHFSGTFGQAFADVTAAFGDTLTNAGR